MTSTPRATSASCTRVPLSSEPMHAGELRSQPERGARRERGRHLAAARDGVAGDADLRVRAFGFRPRRAGGRRSRRTWRRCQSRPRGGSSVCSYSRRLEASGSGFRVHGRASLQLKYHRPQWLRKVLFLPFSLCTAARMRPARRSERAARLASSSTLQERRSLARRVTVESDGKPARTVETGADGRFRSMSRRTAKALLRVRANGFAESVTAARLRRTRTLRDRPASASADRIGDGHRVARRRRRRHGGQRDDRVVRRASHIGRRRRSTMRCATHPASACFAARRRASRIRRRRA